MDGQSPRINNKYTHDLTDWNTDKMILQENSTTRSHISKPLPKYTRNVKFVQNINLENPFIPLLDIFSYPQVPLFYGK